VRVAKGIVGAMVLGILALAALDIYEGLSAAL
jgi:hypothetical protein